MDRALSLKWYNRARSVIPGGVDSPVRAFGSVGMGPLFADHGEGPWLFDADGNRYVDFLMSWGALILGHGNEVVQRAIVEAARRGTGFGLSTRIEAELAELIREAFPSIELIRFVNSGTEAVMSAVRLARGFTGRNRIVKFEGGYHGHSDALLAKAGSGLAALGLPASAGVPDTVTRDTVVFPYNAIEAARVLFAEAGHEIAAVLVEPVAGNMGVIPPLPGFLETLRELCDASGAVLILDEVITGFRIAWGGAQERFGIRADLTTLGKIIGGGLPVGAFGGRRDIMRLLAPDGPVYQAGTLSGNPVVLAAGMAALQALRSLNPYADIESRADRLARGLAESAARHGIPLTVNRIGGMFTPFFTEGVVMDYTTARQADAKRYAVFFRGMIERGILLPPSPWESAFVSACHHEETIAETLRSANEVIGHVSHPPPETDCV